MARPENHWDDEWLDYLREAWRLNERSVKGIAADMTAKFRHPFTKNSVAGKAHRLVLPARPVPASLAKFAGPNRVKRGPGPEARGAAELSAARHRTDAAAKVVMLQRTAPRPPKPSKLQPVATAHQRNMSGRCCWPMWLNHESSGAAIGKPRFCGDPAEVGVPYCDDHRKVAYVRVRDRREDAAA